MSADEAKAKIDSAVEAAIAGDADLAEVDAHLSDARDRLQAIRQYRGQA